MFENGESYEKDHGREPDQAAGDPRHDDRPYRLAGVPGVFEGAAGAHHASDRADDLPHHVLFYRRGLLSHAGSEPVHAAAVRVRGDLALCVHLRVAGLCGRAVVYPVLLRRDPEPDERDVVAGLGPRDAARGESPGLQPAQKDAAGRIDLPGELPERLELHREPLRARVRHEPRGSEGAGAVAAVLRGAVCGGVLLRAGRGLWPSADGGSAVAAGARAL